MHLVVDTLQVCDRCRPAIGMHTSPVAIMVIISTECVCMAMAGPLEQSDA
jgi:hypothetical protein